MTLTLRIENYQSLEGGSPMLLVEQRMAERRNADSVEAVA